ncbi:MAG: RHS repeat-associated core domain-containing protein [Planctomycetaceae bacterium]
MKNNYNDQGQLYDTRTYKVDPSTGSASYFFVKVNYFDRNGRVVAVDNSRTNRQEFAFDGLGRMYQSRQVLALESTKYDGSGVYQYRAPVPDPDLSSMTGGDDKVLSMSHTVYDDFLAIGTHTLTNIHSDVTAGTAGIDLSNNDDYIRSTQYQWYDDNDNVTATADYGSGDTAMGAGEWKYASIPTRPSTAPSTSDTVLVTTNSYNSNTGGLESVTDPAGKVSKTVYDDMRRVLYSISNYDDFNESTEANTGDSTDKSKDRVVKYVYPTTTNKTQIIAMDPDGNGNLSDNQVTTSLHEDAIDPTRVTNTIYPDSSDTTSSGTDQVKMTYNLAGQITQKTNQLGTVFDHTFTSKRQPELTKVTTLGTGVDGHIRSTKMSYNSYDQLEKLTSYANSDGTGTVRNEIQYTYNDLSQVVRMYQSHEGAVNTSTSLYVENGYDATVGGVVFERDHRQDTLTYPDGRVIFYDYNTSVNNLGFHNQFSHIQKLRETNSSGTELVEYEYLGNGQVVTLDLYEPDVELDYFQGTSGTYAGLDRFGRAKDQYWKGYNSTSDVDQFGYSHNYLGQRMTRDINSSIYASNDKDQAFTYDGLSRLVDFDEGTLSSGSISGTPTEEETWTLDGLGNWTNYVMKTSGSTDLDQTRTLGSFNEISNITETTGTAWANPAYDAVGSMTSIPKPADLTGTYTATYDAWGRLVKLVDGANTVAEFEYDGLNRRILKHRYTSGSLTDSLHYYYNENWQVLEARKEVSSVEDTDPLEQFVWHPLYIDAPVLRDYDDNTDGTADRHYYTFDANYNVTALVDDSGTVLERYHYSPYGTQIVLDANFATDGDGVSDVLNEVTYTGRQFDIDTGLYHYRNRYYHNQLGMFVSRDPIEFSGETFNLSQYVNSNPGNDIDPSGLKCGVCDHNIYFSGKFKDLDQLVDGEPFTKLGEAQLRSMAEDAPNKQIYNFGSAGDYFMAYIPRRSLPTFYATDIIWNTLFFVTWKVCEDETEEGVFSKCYLDLYEERSLSVAYPRNPIIPDVIKEEKFYTT